MPRNIQSKEACSIPDCLAAGERIKEVDLTALAGGFDFNLLMQ